MKKIGILSLSYGNYVGLDDYIKLEQALNKIREYIKKTTHYTNLKIPSGKMVCYEIEKIIDKYLGGKE